MTTPSHDAAPQADDENPRSRDSHAIPDDPAAIDLETLESLTLSFRESLTSSHQARDKIQQALEKALDSSLRLTTYPLPVTLSIKHLENRLWSGYSHYAIPALDALKLDLSLPSTDRHAAAYQLARRYLFEGDYSRALENIELAKALIGTPTPQITIALVSSLLLLGRCADALLCIEEALQRKPERDYPLIRSRVIRHTELADGHSPEKVDAAQLAALNPMFEKAGLAPVEKRYPDAAVSLGNLVSHAPASKTPQDQRVSIIVPASNAEKSIEWALVSIREQTWKNLEIIVVDEGTDSTAEIVTRMASIDPRVRLLGQQPARRGAHAARSAGVRAATGDLIMIHGSDEWSHPQRMALMINGLRENTAAVAALSFLARVNTNFEVLSSWDTGASLVLPSLSSLLFRREIIDEVGLWDEVAMGADGELVNRLKCKFGSKSIAELPKKQLLSFSLASEASLSTDAAHSSIKYGLTWNYHDSYAFWHTKAEQSGRTPRLNPSSEARPFPVPVGNRLTHTSPPSYDLIVIGDFAARGALLESTLSHLKNAGRNGRSIAAFHWRHYESGSKDSLQPAFYEACLRYAIDILSPCDTVNADTLLISPPSLLQYRLDPLPTFRVERVAVVVDLLKGSSVEYQRYDPLVVRSHLHSIFGVEGIWVAASARVKRLMQSDKRFPPPATLSALPMLATAESSVNSPEADAQATAGSN